MYTRGPYLLLACLVADVVMVQLLEQLVLPARWQGQLPRLGQHLLRVSLHGTSMIVSHMVSTRMLHLLTCAGEACDL